MSQVNQRLLEFYDADQLEPVAPRPIQVGRISLPPRPLLTTSLRIPLLCQLAAHHLRAHQAFGGTLDLATCGQRRVMDERPALWAEVREQELVAAGPAPAPSPAVLALQRAARAGVALESQIPWWPARPDAPPYATPAPAPHEPRGGRASAGGSSPSCKQLPAPPCDAGTRGTLPAPEGRSLQGVVAQRARRLPHARGRGAWAAALWALLGAVLGRAQRWFRRQR